ncbi:MAG: hypothetical protein BWY81_01422 [Firmicutes bacterium ADurb.Bin467]|nr:MAG: hypothetical protein BWY81_01422 [Firmicutes bacterium ADurb.Bin467]
MSLALPLPISSVGSGLSISGCNCAIACASSIVSAQQNDSMSNSFARAIVRLIAESVIGRSQWLMTTPCAPAAFTASGSTSAMPRPGRSVSMYGARTIRCGQCSRILRISV